MKQETITVRSHSRLLGAGLGAITSLPVIALAFLGAKFAGLRFFPFDVFDLLARVLPGNIITLGIDTMVRIIGSLRLGTISATAKDMEQAMGIGLVIAAGAVFGLALAWLIERSRLSGQNVGAWLGVAALIIMTGIEFVLGVSFAGTAVLSLVWLAVLFVGWGVLLGRWLEALVLAPVTPAAAARGSVPPRIPAGDVSRRAFLAKIVAGSIGAAVLAAGLGVLLERQQSATGAGQALGLATPSPAPSNTPVGGASPSATANAPLLPAGTAGATVRDRVPPAPGTRPELTPNGDFYRIDIDTLPPMLDKAAWKLEIKGLFTKPGTITVADLMAFPAMTQPITLSCISNPVGGDLISTSNWVGVRLRDFLKDRGLMPEAKALAIRAADGFYESVVMEDLTDPRTLLVYGMNGTTLPTAHGFPLRIYIPDRYGMKQPKWITSIEATGQDGPGYWVDRGWSPTARPQIVSVIDTVARDNLENGLVPIGGIAWAGDRGIKQVELRIDGGAWLETTLRTPPLSPLTWVQWRFDWVPIPGLHTFQVRATDGTGALQVEQASDTYPNGATGYHSAQAYI